MRTLKNHRFGDEAALHDSPLDRRLRRISALERCEEARAFLESFPVRSAGVVRIDHHIASGRFTAFHCREQASGRRRRPIRWYGDNYLRRYQVWFGRLLRRWKRWKRLSW